MPQTPQFRYGRQRDVFVGIETGHSGSLVLGNLGIDLRSVRTNVGPSVYKVFRTQSRICREERLLTGVKAVRLCEKPYGNARPDDAGHSAAHVRPRVYPRERVTKLLNDSLQDLRSFAGGKRWQEFLEIADA